MSKNSPYPPEKKETKKTTPSQRSTSAGYTCAHCGHVHKNKKFKGYTGTGFRECDKCGKLLALRWRRALFVEVSAINFVEEEIQDTQKASVEAQTLGGKAPTVKKK